MKRYTMYYRTPKNETWQSFGIYYREPFSGTDIDRYREMLSKRYMVRGDEIELKQIEEKLL